MSDSVPPRRLSGPIRFLINIPVALYRSTGGRFGGRMGSARILLLTTIGRKSGAPHTVALGYFDDEPNLFIVASNNGSDRHPAWYLNLTAHPEVEIQVKDQRRRMIATTATPEERERLWARLATEAKQYTDYQKKTRREIPIVILRATEE
jgi:F420H(2)-dependent quinone reductase